MIPTMTASRIVLDGATYLVVHRRDLCNVDDEGARRDLVGACLEDPAGRAAARRLVEELTGGIMLGASDVARELDRLLESGRVVAVRERGAVRLLDAPRRRDPVWGRDEPGIFDGPIRPVVSPARGSDRPLDPDEPVVDTTWIELHLVDEEGSPVSGERIAVRFPDGSETQGYLDADGRWRLDGIPSGTYQVCFPDVDGVWRSARPERPKTRALVHRCTRAACRFSEGGVLPSLPSHPAGVGLVAALAANWPELGGSPDRRLYVVGRRGPGERTEKDVDVLRARGVIALVHDQVEDWVDVATLGGSYSEVQRLLAEIGETLGWPCDPGTRDGVETETSRSAVEAFQHAFNDAKLGAIVEDGICGPETLGAIFRVMRRELETTSAACSIDLGSPAFAAALHGGIGEAPLPGDAEPCDERGPSVELVAAGPGAVSLSAAPFVPADAIVDPIVPVDVRLTPVADNDFLALVLLDRRGQRMPRTKFLARFGREPPTEGTSDASGVARIEMPRICAEGMEVAWDPTDDDRGFRYARRISIDCTRGETRQRASSVLRNLGYVPDPLGDAVWEFQRAHEVDLDPRPRGLVDDDIPADTLAAIERRFAEIIRG